MHLAVKSTTLKNYRTYGEFSGHFVDFRTFQNS